MTVPHAGNVVRDAMETNTKPPYRLIADSIREKVLAGEYALGKLPSERALIRQYGISRATAAKVLATLESEGLVVRRRGAGAFVNHRRHGRARVLLRHLRLDRRPRAGLQPQPDLGRPAGVQRTFARRLARRLRRPLQGGEHQGRVLRPAGRHGRAGRRAPQPGDRRNAPSQGHHRRPHRPRHRPLPAPQRLRLRRHRQRAGGPSRAAAAASCT